MKKPRQNHLLDRLHRGVVISCIGLTLYGSYLLGARVYRYFTVIRPAIKEAELKRIEEQSSLDKAPELKA
ncbi:unnamed protein product [Hermetia illucens]|uniref:Uncharacterized protein n=1 Tax=Hermetia illucens TaxID=343691 RepID=A0A7R8UVM9_HERIL|nr:uncharacterized protein LOC119655723 [Hermetia illucens]CAD7087464.1 unnamed protein product [Hermetia illucens]